MEIERKFLLKSLPPLEPGQKVLVESIYISTSPEVRLRSFEVLEGKDIGHIDYKLTIKGEGSLSREEIETYVDESFFNSVKSFINKPVIRNYLYLYEYESNILQCAVIDIDRNKDFSLITGEVEFNSEASANSYTWPFDYIKDVTMNPSYKMKNYWLQTRVNN